MNKYIVTCVPLKKCPWCGWPGALDFSSLEEPNGRGYAGCFAVCVKCTNPNCGAIHPQGTFNDIYCETQEAVDKAAKIWNLRGC